MAKMKTREYRRRVFNKALLECFARIHSEILDECEENGEKNPRLQQLAHIMSDAFFGEELNLQESTVAATRRRLLEASTFIQDCAEASEDIADAKAQTVEEEGIEMEEDQEVQLSEEDQEVIEQLFDIKKPVEEIESIRDATVAALIAEDKKAQEIKDAYDLAKSQVAAGAPEETMEETVNRMNAIGPTSLMNGIMNFYSMAAIKDINENGTFKSVSDAMHQNRDEIKNRSVMMYTLFEMASRFSLRSFTPEEVKKLSFELYYGK